jgi:hypothetical protein
MDILLELYKTTLPVVEMLRLKYQDMEEVKEYLKKWEKFERQIAEREKPTTPTSVST